MGSGGVRSPEQGSFGVSAGDGRLRLGLRRNWCFRRGCLSRRRRFCGPCVGLAELQRPNLLGEIVVNLDAELGSATAISCKTLTAISATTVGLIDMGRNGDTGLLTRK